GEYLGLNDALPEAVHLLMPGDGEQVSASGLPRVHGACEEIGRMPRVRIREHEQLAARRGRTGGARPLLAEPAWWERWCVHDADARIRRAERARELARAVDRLI